MRHTLHKYFEIPLNNAILCSGTFHLEGKRKSMKSILIICFTVILMSNLFSQTTKNSEKTYPFEIADRDGQYSIIAQIETADLFDKYNPILLPIRVTR